MSVCSSEGGLTKCNGIFNFELAHPKGAGLFFGAAVHAEYGEPTELTDLANAGPPKRLMDRIMQLRIIFIERTAHVCILLTLKHTAHQRLMLQASPYCASKHAALL